ncbi:MAG: ABC transporter ATP-binding protein [Planctomycetota bacterium]|jgi:ABC-type multidrug transport system fused ATPase/permease subunit|nr:ABC transporter ATP-binding protein [Planctomycetota bacterium]MDP7253166.1 ABC transporter ATP-binding protein [Planctomycetota bacterium]
MGPPPDRHPDSSRSDTPAAAGDGWKHFVRLLTYLLPYRWQLLVGLACLLLSIPAQLFHPLVWKFIVDDVIIGEKHNMLLPALGVMIAVHLTGTGLSVLRTYMLGVVGHRFVCDLRNELYDRVQNHSLRFFHDRRSGDIASRVMGDVETLQHIALNGVDEIISNFLQFICVAVILVWLKWQVGLLTLIPMAAVGGLVWFFNSRMRKIFRRLRDRVGELHGKLQENLLGILVIKAFGGEQHEQQIIEKHSAEYLREGISSIRARTVYHSGVRTVGFFSSVIMVGVGAWYVIQQQFTIGGLVAYRGYWWQLFSPVTSLARTNEMIQRALASASRIFEILDEPVEIEESPDAKEFSAVEGHIKCENLSFGYSEKVAALVDVNLDIPIGNKIGVVGPSGAGKSTLLSMLLRFYDPQNGRILLDGIDVRDATKSSLRQQFAIVTQEPYLFNDTVKNNIIYGTFEAGEHEIEEAATLANAHEFIAALPNQYESIVGERGVKLSGGQKQRLCIARAFLANPHILLLDEATAAVEPESEAIIQAALERLMEGRTTVIVSHRLSMVRDCDQIAVIEDGRVSEQGTHNELMDADEWYARMYRMQMEGEVYVENG